MKTMKSASLLTTIVKSNFTKLSKPYKLNFSVTYWCQSRCIHCSIWQIRPKNELTLDEIKEFAKQNGYFNWIELTGGEPFLRSDIVEVARTFYENCKNLYLLTMPTNSLCNYDMEIRKIEEIVKIGIPNVVITISLDGYKEMEDKIRGVPGNYDKALNMFRGIKELRKKYPNLNCVFGYTIIKHNVGQLERMVTEVMRDVPGTNYADFHVNIGQLSGNYYSNEGNDIKATPEMAVTDVKFLLEKMKSVKGLDLVKGAQTYLEIKYMEGLIKFLQNGKSPVPNRDGELSVFLDSYGSVYPSIMTTERVGNIRENGKDMLAMLKNYHADGTKQNYYTACESYQSILGTILKV